MNYKNIFWLSILFVTTTCLANSKLSITPKGPEKYAVQVQLDIPQDDLIYYDYLDISADTNDISLAQWHANQEPITHFDRSFKEHKKAYKGPVQLSFEITAPDASALNASHLHISYYQASKKQLIQESLALQLPCATAQPEELSLQTSIDTSAAQSQEVDDEDDDDDMYEIEEDQSWSEYLSDLLISTNSLLLQLLIIFILGLLMSLTPCIYPMIPITAGILQAQGSRSVVINFLLSGSYTLGTATMFAILGLLAAFTGTALGSLMVQPWFLIPIIVLLIYLAFSMFGWYEIYIPRFLQPKHHTVSSGSFFSAFVFGAISGTVASPCLSPGLVLLLSIVAALKSVFLGFILLFVFGLGLSLPLLIIGTFSGSLHVLPRAGMWMIEIKKIFGLLLLLMCFYFLHFIFPMKIIWWLLTMFVLIAGIMYLHSAQRTKNNQSALIKNVLGIILVASSVMLIFKSYQQLYLKECPITDSIWYTDFQCAKDIARHEKKLLFVDIGAPYCSLCKELDRTLFSDPKVIKQLKHFVPVKLDGSKEENKPILKAYTVFGFPTILIIDAEDGSLLRKWGSDLYGIETSAFITLLNAL